MKIVLTNEDVKRVLKDYVLHHFGTSLCAENADEITFNDYMLPWDELKFEKLAHAQDMEKEIKEGEPDEV